MAAPLVKEVRVMATGKTPCGIAIPQVFSDTAVDINLIQQFVQKAETLDYESLWVQESIVGNVPVLEPLSLLTYAAALPSFLCKETATTEIDTFHDVPPTTGSGR